MTVITPQYFYHAGRLLTGKAITVTGGIIREISEATSVGDQSPYILMPGCHDIQVNGGGGVMVNSDPSPEGLRKIAVAHEKLGTTAIMPTVITDTADVIDAAADAAIAVRDDPNQLGLHIEGPHIAVEKRGTHNADFIRPLDDRTLATLVRLRQAGVTVMMTLAPELASDEQLDALARLGVILSAGHSNASADQARGALDHGVTVFTHLFNAMPQMKSRTPGIVGAAILSNAYCGLIADGIHVSWDMLKIAIAARPIANRMFLVSDAMATVGGPDYFDLYGKRITVKNGRLINDEGALAGAHLDMVTALRNLHQFADVPLAECIAMATDNPRMAIGHLPIDPINMPIDQFIALDDELTLTDLHGRHAF